MLFNTIIENWLNVTDWNTDYLISFLFRFILYVVVLMIVARGLYYPTSKRRDYLFTYLLIGTVIFLLCFLLENVKLELGMALGLFAIFGIIRFRTGQIPIKEMTYLFTVIGLAVINALANGNMGLIEPLVINLIVITIIWILEKLWTVKHISQKVVQYDRIDLIRPENYTELMSDLQTRLGLNITRIDIGKVDFIRDAAKLVVYYDAANSHLNWADDLEQLNPQDED